MPSAFRVKTFTELLNSAIAHLRALQQANDDVPPDITPGSFLRSILEAVCLNDAGQYVQIGKLRNLFSIFKAKGDDLDERMVDLGSEIWEDMRRRPASVSVCKIAVSGPTSLIKSVLVDDVLVGATTFAITSGDGDSFPTSGAVALERGTERAEDIIYTRSGDVFTVLSPSTGVLFGHASGVSVTRVSTRSLLSGAVAVGALTATLASTTGAAWPIAGAVIFERGTIREEKRAFTRSGDVLTLTPALTFAHADGTVVVQTIVGSSNQNIPAGRTCYAPASESTKQINFRTLQPGVLLDGDYTSALIDVASVDVGSSTRVGANTITRWEGAPPFTGATVTNPIAAAGGRDREKDDAYVQRGLDFIQSLSRSTPLAVTTLLAGVQDPVSNRTVEFAQIIEPVVLGDKSILYITDGTTTFGLTQVPFLGRDVVIRDAETNDRRGRLSQSAPYSYTTTPALPRLFKSIQRGEATDVGVDYLEDGNLTMLSNYYVGSYLKTDDDQFYEILSNTAIRFTIAAATTVPSMGAYAVVDFGTNPQISSTSTSTSSDTLTDSSLSMTSNAHVGKWLTDSADVSWLITANTSTAFTLAANGDTPASGAYKVTAGSPKPLIPGVDFQFNESKGDLELSTVNALQRHDCLVAASDGASPSVGAYLYTTGLGAYVQKVVNGDPSNFDAFPGIRATGTQILVKAPLVVSQTFVIKVIAAQGITSTSIAPAVKVAVQTYINSLGIGDNVINAEVIAAVMDVPGVEDCAILSPASNPVVADGQIVRVSDTHIEVV